MDKPPQDMPDSKPLPAKHKLTGKEIHFLALMQAARKLQAKRKAERAKSGSESAIVPGGPPEHYADF